MVKKIFKYIAIMLVVLFGILVAYLSYLLYAPFQRAEEGNVDNQYYLGRLYLDGDGLAFSRDYVKSAKWFRKAAEQGHIEAQYYLT